MGRAVVLTTAACLITAGPVAARTSATETVEPTVTSMPSVRPTDTTTSEPTGTPEDPTETTTSEPTQDEPPAAPGEGAIAERYENLPEHVRAAVGEPTDDEVVVGESLRYRDFENARFYWTPEYDVKIVFGGILHKFMALGAHEGVGVPTTDELATGDGVGRYSEFVDREFGTETAIYWTPETGPHEVRGQILQHWEELGGWETLGYPTTDSNLTPDAFGVYNHFVAASGTESSVYWTQPNGAHAVQGAIRAKWAASGWEMGPMGYPTSDEITAEDGVGRYNTFSGRDGLPAGIVWSPDTGAHMVQGRIAEVYIGLAGPNGVLGYPTTDERTTPDGIGRYNHFTGASGSSIYWSPRTGAHEIYGAIRARWESLGWERSYLGYPTSGEYSVPEGRRNTFQHGTITWNINTGEVTDRPW